MKHLIAIVLLIGLLPGVNVANAQMKVGYTNIEYLMNFMPEMKEVNKKLDNYRRSLEGKIKVKEEYYMTLVQEYSEMKQAGVLTPEKEQKMTGNIKNVEMEIQESMVESDEKLMAKQMELLQPLQEQLQKVIDEVAKENGYSYIINNSNSMGVSNILYGVDAYDVTDEIAAKLNIDLPDSQ